MGTTDGVIDGVDVGTFEGNKGENVGRFEGLELGTLVGIELGAFDG